MWFPLLLLFLSHSYAADESCVGRCQNGFDPLRKCQCDNMCRYHGSCCIDFDTSCRHKVTRGDTFVDSEDEQMSNINYTTLPPMTSRAPTTPVPTTTQPPTPHPDPDAVTCSGRPFDAFMQLKNGSIYAFRGEYFFELDDRSVKPGYPKLIKDVWGIAGPIDAAFTRINCQGKTYIFKGNKYWRFDDGILEEDYPRDISVGFNKIPDDVDAAFAIPAPGHHGKEKVYFFKGDQYYQYEFQHQPSHEECVRLTKSSPSLLFSRYTDMYCNDGWDSLFTLLFQGLEGHHKGPRFISKDWVGIKPPIDAAMVGRLYISVPPTSAPAAGKGRRKGWRKRKGRRGQKSRRSRSLFWEDFFLDYEERYDDARKLSSELEYTDYELTQENSMPVQNVFFFKKDKYYRVDLQTKQIDYVTPPYPRPIAKYWLGCKDLAEK
ncbi:vitronectin-like [Denticeps clupeoides]|uniref:vitronectin-like n=1 Tax=Denticeps clupeoides TaxID=299321 RepID=UPI0010A3E83C|nr:vitronectin-like [Denticeps clupeoides]XP_028840139.1 vitronectin-like [Denticeps clupeoides]